VVRLEDPISIEVDGAAGAIGRHSARMRLLSGQG
jgi:hypothetical protein